jgi:hypothetical protein
MVRPPSKNRCGQFKAVGQTPKVATMAKVAFLGLGVMGFPMAGHLVKKGGHEVTVYNRTAAKAKQWAGMLEERKIDPRDAFVVGDDLRADILPMLELGIGAAIWVNNGKLPEDVFWAYEVPRGVRKISTVGELVKFF